MLTAITLMLSMGMVVLLGSELVGKPSKKLIEKTRRIGQGDLSGPVHLQRHDEFGELATAINSMCEQLVEVQSKATQETRTNRLRSNSCVMRTDCEPSGVWLPVLLTNWARP